MASESYSIVRFASQECTEYSMAMQMHKAFNARMLTKLTKYSLAAGTYNDDNVWVEGEVTSSKIWGVLKTGNQFSQFDQGQALQTEDGGERFSDFRTLFVTDKFPIDKGDKVGHKGLYYNVLQRSDESVYGFYSVLLEKSEEWTA